MSLKPFQTSLLQTLNGIDTFSFSHVISATEHATRFYEGATLEAVYDGTPMFGGKIKTLEAKYSGRVKTITVESPVSAIRDTDLAEEEARPMTSTKNLIAGILPEGFTLTFKPERNPNMIYAFKSGSIITHLNTLCAANGFNWRTNFKSATEADIVVAEAGEYTDDLIELVENVNVFNVKVDTSLFKKYTQVTAIGAEEEVAGYTCVASFNTATYFLLDCDDGELANDELIPQLDPYSFVTGTRSFDLQYGYDLKGWGDQTANNVVRVNDEFIQIEFKSGSRVFIKERGAWWSADSSTHSYGDPVVLTQYLPVSIPEGQTGQISPATTLFKIGSEIIQGDYLQGDYSNGAIQLATVNTTTGLYEGRGLALKELGTELKWVGKTTNIYAHKRGTPVIPYYPDSNPASVATTLACVVHGKGIVTKDGIDKLAWGILRNIQNGIISAKMTFKAADFWDSSVTVGARARLTTATVTTGATSVIVPATSYDLVIYSISRKQNSLLELELGNVEGEVMQMLKSGEYALQAALRKTIAPRELDAAEVSIKGTVCTTAAGKKVRIKW